jgi:DNA helicase-2/ATP-dependent DNA helicase PcrA
MTIFQTGGHAEKVLAASEPRRIKEGTSQQEALWRELVEGTSNIMVEARAGCGKSSSCREGMWRVLDRRPAERIRYAVFNKANAEEFRGDCPPGVEVGTLHSFGLAACKAAFNSSVEPKKTYLTLDGMRSGVALPRYMRKSVATLVGLCKNHALSADTADIERIIRNLALHHNVKLYGYGDRIAEIVRDVLKKARDWTEILDFDDLIWLPGLYALEFPKVDLLFVDECQDLNAAQHQMIRLMCAEGRIVCVGDRFQAIYAFRGADADSIPTMEAMLQASPRGLSRLPLTLTFRCPQRHVRLANAFVSDLEAHNSNPEGEVESGVEADDMLQRVRPGDMVICPTNAQLISSCLRQLALRRPAFVRGRSVGEQLVGLYYGLGDHATMASLCAAIQRWQARELERLSEMDGVEDVVEDVQDRAAGLQAIVASCATPSQVPAAIRDLFTENGVRPDSICFSSIHRAKGLESSNIWYMDAPTRTPKQAWEERQQQNLRYVGLTRSKRYLGFVNVK